MPSRTCRKPSGGARVASLSRRVLSRLREGVLVAGEFAKRLPAGPSWRERAELTYLSSAAPADRLSGPRRCSGRSRLPISRAHFSLTGRARAQKTARGPGRRVRALRILRQHLTERSLPQQMPPSRSLVVFFTTRSLAVQLFRRYTPALQGLPSARSASPASSTSAVVGPHFFRRGAL
jgi:hypothetical protein